MISLLVLLSSFLLSTLWFRLLHLLLLLLVLRSFHLSLFLCLLLLFRFRLLLRLFFSLLLSSAYPHPPVSTPLPSVPLLGISNPSVRPPLGFSASAASNFPSFAPTIPLLRLLPLLLAFPCALLLHLCLRFWGLLLLRFLRLRLRSFALSLCPVLQSLRYRLRLRLLFLVRFLILRLVSLRFLRRLRCLLLLLPRPLSLALLRITLTRGPGYPDAVPRDLEVPLPPSIPDSFQAEIRCMYAYLVDLFPQAVGAPAVDPPPCALFEEFFTPASVPQQPIYLNWFAHVRTTLEETDSRLASFLASGRPDFAFLLSRSSQYAVRGEFAQGSAAAVNPSLLALFEHPLRPTLQLGLMIREAAALEASFRAHSESLSHSMWLLSWLLVFVRLQGFQPADSTLFNTLMTSLLKILAHQASVSASHTAFVGLKRRQFYLSHLSAYFSEVNKRAMLSSPLVCSDSLFAESDIARLVSDTQALSSLHS